LDRGRIEVERERRKARETIKRTEKRRIENSLD